MDDLSDQELSHILAYVPFSQSKVGLQAVSHRWRRVLTLPESHSYTTFEEDQAILAAEPQISLPLWAVLPCVKGNGALVHRLPNGGANLQAMQLSSFPEGCPVLPKLQKLHILEVGSKLQPVWRVYGQMLTAFPALREFAAGEHGSHPDIQWSFLLTQLSAMPTLRTVRLYFDEAYLLPVFTGHPDCALHLSVGYSSDMRKLCIQTAEHLVSLCCWMRYDTSINFSEWQHCTQLRSITIALEKTLPNCMAARPIYGLDKLPALHKLVLYSVEESVCMPPVSLPVGWQAEMSEFVEPMSSAGLFSSGRNQLLTVTRKTA